MQYHSVVRVTFALRRSLRVVGRVGDRFGDAERTRNMRVRFLNNLYHSKTCQISGEELGQLIELKFGRLYKPDVVCRASHRYFVVTREETDEKHVHRVAETLSEISHREFVKSMIVKSEIAFDENDVLMEFRVVN